MMARRERGSAETSPLSEPLWSSESVVGCAKRRNGCMLFRLPRESASVSGRYCVWHLPLFVELAIMCMLKNRR